MFLEQLQIGRDITNNTVLFTLVFPCTYVSAVCYISWYPILYAAAPYVICVRYLHSGSWDLLVNVRRQRQPSFVSQNAHHSAQYSPVPLLPTITHQPRFNGTNWCRQDVLFTGTNIKPMKHDALLT